MDTDLCDRTCGQGHHVYGLRFVSESTDSERFNCLNRGGWVDGALGTAKLGVDSMFEGFCPTPKSWCGIFADASWSTGFGRKSTTRPSEAGKSSSRNVSLSESCLVIATGRPPCLIEPGPWSTQALHHISYWLLSGRLRKPLRDTNRCVQATRIRALNEAVKQAWDESLTHFQP